ncbi:MAG: hypothetical protein P4M14_03880 [Gammaproteobacteria bacterium]|nr:hypothetical protein [Gammaproteobacteria bacterium]
MSSVRQIQKMFLPQLTAGEKAAALEMKGYFTTGQSEFGGPPKSSGSSSSSVITDVDFNPVFGAKRTFVYKKGLMSLWLETKPTTAEDFYELLHAVNNSDHGYYGDHIEIFYNRADAITKEDFRQMQHEFSCDLLSDASRAGHVRAKEQLMIWAIECEDKVAASKLEYQKFNCKDDLIIYLPKRFQTADEMERLAKALKKGGVGVYFWMEKPEHAMFLSNKLLQIVRIMRREEARLAAEMSCQHAQRHVAKQKVAELRPSSVPTIEEVSAQLEVIDLEEQDEPASLSSPHGASTTSAEPIDSDQESYSRNSPESEVDEEKNKDQEIKSEARWFPCLR